MRTKGNRRFLRAAGVVLVAASLNLAHDSAGTASGGEPRAAASHEVSLLDADLAAPLTWAAQAKPRSEV
jgi:hypothetical protein